MIEFVWLLLGLVILLLPVASAVVAFGARSRMRVLSEENERLDRRVRDLEFRASQSSAPSARADDVRFPAPPPWALKTKPVVEPVVAARAIGEVGHARGVVASGSPLCHDGQKGGFILIKGSKPGDQDIVFTIANDAIGPKTTVEEIPAVLSHQQIISGAPEQ